MGGTNDRTNLVKLTAREHFIAHLLLIEIYPENEKLIYAAWMMSNTRSLKYSSRMYEYIKTRVSEDMSRRMSGINNPNFGKPLTEEKKLVFNSKGIQHSNESRKRRSDRMKGAGNPNFGKPAHNKNKPHSEETKMKLKIAAQNRERVTCPHCSKTSSINQIKRYHLDNCKLRK
jgi:hypothetical protein